jgi:hypothetical protein
MPDTPYTEGFKAGLEWEKKRIIRLLEEADSACTDWAVALIEWEAE